MTARLTRRERAAMQLALEVLRFDTAYQALRPKCDDEAVTDTHAACTALREGVRGRRLAWGLETVADAALGAARVDPLSGRLIRARLALYLRARLRADRGEDRHRVGPCSACDGSGIGDYARDPSTGEWTASRCCEVCDGHGHLFRITPLWQLAPAHGMWRHPCADGRPADLPRGEACGVCGASEPRRARR